MFKVVKSLFRFMCLYKESYDTERLGHVVVDIDAILLERTRVLIS